MHLDISDIIETKSEAFSEGIIDVDLFEIFLKQKEALELLTDEHTEEILYGGAAGGGKSWIGCEWLIWSCLAYPGSNWFIGRKVLKVLKKSTLKTFHKVAKKHGLKQGKDYKVNLQDSYIRFNNGEDGYKDGSNIDLLDLMYKPSDTEYEELGSTEYTGGWIEEGGEVHQSAYEVLNTRIGRHLNDQFGVTGKLFITCNPKRNWMYRLFYKPWVDEALVKDKAFVQALIDDNTKIDKGYSKKLEQLKGSKRKRLKLGLWEYEDDPLCLIDPESREAIRYNERVPTGRRYVTADIALRGSDLFVVAAWNGFRIEELVYIPKCDADVVEHVIKDVAKRNKVFSNTDIIVDADGIGAYLKGYIKGVKGFVANEPPVKIEGDKNYNKINDQVSFRMAGRIDKKEVYINPDGIRRFDPKTMTYKSANVDGVFELIVEELGEVKEDPAFEGKLKVMSKKDVKENIGRSPDYWDVLKMRESFELLPPPPPPRRIRRIKTY